MHEGLLINTNQDKTMQGFLAFIVYIRKDNTYDTAKHKQTEMDYHDSDHHDNLRMQQRRERWY